MSLAVMVLRYTSPQNREWKVPGNLHIKGVEIPVGLGLISLVLFSTAIVNLFTKAVGDHRGRNLQSCVLRRPYHLRAQDRAPARAG